jgi:hypothetical protein
VDQGGSKLLPGRKKEVKPDDDEDLDHEIRELEDQLKGQSPPSGKKDAGGGLKKKEGVLEKTEAAQKVALTMALEEARKKQKKGSSKFAKLRKLLQGSDKKKKDAESDSDASSDESDSDFGGGSSLSGRFRKLTRVHQKAPGRLAQMGLRKMNEWVAARGGAEVDEGVALPPVAVNYLLTVWVPTRGEKKVNVGVLRRMRTLATAIDHLAKGRTLRALDLLVQRMKAEEMAQEEAAWSNAQWLELLPRTEVSMTSDAERRLAGQEEKKERDRLEALQKNLAPGDAAGPQGLRNAEDGIAMKKKKGEKKQMWWSRKKGYMKQGGKWVRRKKGG